MIATRVTTYRAASIALVLAASAFVCKPTREVRAPTPSIHTESALELDVPLETSTAQEPAPPPLGGRWKGTCHEGERGWPTMPVTLALTVNRDGSIDATGTLAFVDRRTRATLHGRLSNGRFALDGHMKEVGGIYTDWHIDVNGRFVSADHIVGWFREVYPRSLGVGGAVMCTFDWRR